MDHDQRLRVGLDGVGWDTYEESFGRHQLVQFRYAYFGLPALDAEQYASGENILGVALAVLMHVSEDRRAELAAEVLQRVARSGENEYRKFLLAECAWAYSGMSEEQSEALNKLLNHEPYHEARAMTTTFYEQGLQRGIETGTRQALLLLVTQRFGPLNPSLRERLERLTPAEVQEMLLAFATANSLRDLGLAD